MPNDGFVLYNVGKDLYRVADKDVKAFESENPDASIKYSTDDYDFDIPLSQREEFLKDVPNATFSQYDDKQWQKSKGKDWAPSKYAGLSYDELLKIRDDQRLDAEPFISEYEEKAKKSLHWRGSSVPADAKWLTENKARYDAAKADVTDLARSIKAAPEYKAVREGATDAIKAQKQIIDTAEEEVYQDAQRAFDAQRANMTTKDRIVKAFGSGSNEADPFGEYDPNTYRGWINTEGYEGFGSNIDNYEAAKNILSNAEKTLKSVTKTDVKAAGDKKLDVIMKGVGQGIGHYVSDLDSWSAILGAKHALPVYALQQKLDTIFRGMGEDITLEEMDKRISDGLTPSEQALFYAIETAGGISEALDKEIHGSVKAGESMAMSARMGLEFLLLSGMSGAANATVARNIEKRLARKLITKETPKAARKVISSLIKVGAEDTGALVGGGIQTALGPSNWAQVAKNIQNNYQQFIASNSFTSLMDPEVRAANGIDTPTLGGLTLEGLVQQLIENATEFGFGPTNKAIGYLQRAGYKGFSKLGWNHIASLLTPQAAATLKKMGIQPLGEEFGEEVNGALISWVRGTERDDEGRNVALKNFFDAENLAILFASFVPTIGFGSVVSAVQRGAANVRFDEARTAYRDYLISNGVAEDKATNIVDSLNGSTPEELGRRAARLLDNARTSSAPGKETEAGLILNLLEAARDKSALDGVASIKRNADRDNTFDEILGNTNKQFWQTREEDAEDEFGNQYKEDVQFVDVLTTNGENNFFIRKEDENGNVETIDENGTIRRFTAAEVEQGLADGTFTGRRQMDMADYLDERNGVKEDAVWEVSAERTSQMAAYDAGNQTGQNHKAMQESAYDTAQNLESARLAAIEAGVPEDDLRLGSDVLARQAFDERQAGNTELATALDNYATAKAAYDGLKEGYIASRVQIGRNNAESYIKAFGRNDRIISGMYTDAKGEMHEGYILSEDIAIARDGSVTVIGGTGDSMVQVSDGKGGVVLVPASQLSAYSTTFDEYRNEFDAASRQWAENAFAEAESRPSRTAMSNDIAPLVGRTILVNGQDGAVGSMTIVSVNTDAGTVTFKDKSGGGAQNTISIDTLYGMAQRDAEGHIVLDPTATENKPIIEAAQQQAEASASEEAETPQAPQLRVGDEVPVVFEGQPANAMVTGIDNDGSITFSILNEAGEDVRAGRVSGQEFANMMNAASTPAPAAPAQSPTPAPSPAPEPAPAATRLTPEQEYENVFSDDNFETEDEAYGFVKGKVKRAKDAADKAQAAVDKIKPEDFDTSQAYRTAKDKAKKDAEPAIADYEHWKAVKDLADAGRRSEKERQERLARMEERALMEPHGMREVVANAFSANHSLDREDFKRETGLSDAELRRFFPFWAKKGKGMTVKAFAESIAASDDTGLLPRDGETGAVDINSIRSEIIDLILSSQSPRDIMDYTRNENIRRREEAERYAEGAPEDLPMTPEEAEAEKQQPFIDRIREWEQRTGVRVNAISQEQDVTEQQAREAIQQGRKITGWFNKFNGSVEIYLPNITSISEIDATFMHEVISHKGLRELFKEVDADGNVSYEKYNRLLDAVWNDIMTEADRQKYIDYVNRGGEQFENEDARRRAAADEYIAYFSETLNPDVNPTGWEKFVELVKSLLDSMGFKITKEDLSRILYSSLANFEKNRFEEQPVRESTGNGSDFAAPFDEDALGFREVTDPAKIAELEAGEKVIGYRTVVLNEDGTLSSPMAGRLGEVNSKKGEKRSAATSSFSFGKWEEAEENPSLADENGKIRLIKPKTRKVKLTDVDKVDYNPYVHLRLDKINRQFKDAWKRPDLVYISSEVPASEVNNPDPYHAEKAALPVGIHDWNGGALMLSRYDKPQAQVPWEEVADAWAADEEFQKNGVNFDIVPPQILSMLQERGIEILPPHNGMGEACNKAYNAWKVGDLLSYRSWRDSGKGLLGRKLSMDEIAKKYEINKEYLEAVEAGDMAKAQDIVDQAAQAAGYTVKAFHGSLSKDITRFDKDKIGSRYAYDERGFFFTSSPTIAGYYASSEFDSSRKGKVYPVFLRLQNPLVVDAKFARKEGLGRRFSDMDAIEVWDNYQSFLLDKVDEGGNDGVLINDGQTQMYVVFDANQIKSAEPVTRDDNGKVIPLSERFNERSNDLRFREANESQEIFVSNAAKALEGISQDKATPEQWLKMIESKGGLKAGEDKWIGLTDWIKSRRRKTLTKQEIEDYINEHKIQIEEVHYGDDSEEMKVAMGLLQNEFRGYLGDRESLYEEADKDVARFYDAMQSKYGDNYLEELTIGEEVTEARLLRRREELEEMSDGEIAFQQMVDKYGDDFKSAFRVDSDGELAYETDMYGELYPETRYFLEEALRDVNYQFEEKRPINSTRLGYTTAGLKNNREIALTVPTVEPYNESDNIHFGDAGEGRAVAWIRFGDTEISRTKEEIQKAEEELRAFDDEMKSKYEDPIHEMSEEELKRFAELVDRTDESKYVLVIDEIQSKRHQDAREKGYWSDVPEYGMPVIPEDLVITEDETQYHTSHYGNDYSVGKGVTPTEAEAREYLASYINEGIQYRNRERKYNSVPNAPFEKNWHELAMKRMLRLAAEEGYDYVAWTTGEQQAERYDIGGVVDSIEINDKEGGLRDVTVKMKDAPDMGFDVSSDGRVVAATDPAFVGNKMLSDYLGKALADRVMSAETGQSIEGDGLRIGGEGMKGFYDQILPRFMDKYGKKWGVKVEDINLPNLGRNRFVRDETGKYHREGLNMHSVKVTPEMKQSVKEGQLMFRETFHGTGADFDRFDHSHMGEGEGGQMYGWGTYVTTNKDTGLAYARSIGGSDEQYERAVRSIENQIDSDNAELKKAQTDEERKALEDDIALMEQRKEEMKRHLYTVEIPDDNGQNYLHWDRPLTIEQVRKIQQAVRERVGDEWGEEFEYELQSALGYGTYGRHVEGGLDYFLGDQKDYATGKDPGAERNSKLLKSLGIVGMEIPIDRQGGQRYEGSNFVIFDESDLEIKDHLRFRESENNSNFVDNGTEDNGAGTAQNETGGPSRDNDGRVSGLSPQKMAIQRDKERIRVLEAGVAPNEREYGGSIDGHTRRRLDQQKEAERLIAAARANGMFIEPGTFSNYPKVNAVSKESTVYRDEENNRAIKVKDPFAAESMADNSPFDELYQHIIHNIFFPESRYEFLGVTTNYGGDEVRFVLAQDWVESHDRVGDVEASNFVKSRGYKVLDGYRYYNDDTIVMDFYGSNIRKDAEGNIHLIDPIIHFKRDPRAIIDDYLSSEEELLPREGSPEAIRAKLDELELEATHKMLDSMESEFGIKINRVSRNEMPKGHETDKGYYDTATGEVTICVDNVANMDDAMATVLHESVGHLGLRRLLGSRFNDAMRDIYDHLDRKGKNWVNRYIASHDLKPGDPGIIEGVEEYLSHLAESGDFKNSVWDEIKQIICDVIDAIFGTDGFTLTDNELNYILRASYENLKDPNWLNTLEGQAKDIALKYQLGINETDPSRPTDPDGGIRFRESSGVARDDFEQDMRGWWNNTVTEHQNKYLPVQLAVKRVMEEVGKKELSEAEDFEAMAVLSSSRAQTEQQEFEMFFFSPILDQVRKIRDRIAGKRASKTERTTAYHEVLDYLYRVSGLERNEYKNNEIEQAKIEAVNNLRADAQARKDAINNDANLSDAEKAARKDAIDAEVSTRVPEIEAEYESRKKDWSGLSSLEGEVDQKALDNLRPLPTDTPKEISRKQAQEADLRRQWWQNAEAKARAAVDDFRSRVGDDAMLTELWDNIRKATDYNLKHALDHGLLTQEEYDRLHGTDTTPRMWNYYLPLRGFAEETAEDVYDYSSFTSSPANGVVVKKMGGRWTEADNPLANILNIAETEIAQGNANMAKQALYRFALNAGENTLLSVRDAWYVKDPTTGKWTVAEVQINPATGKEETLEEFEARMEGLRKSKDQDGKPLARKGRRGLKLDHILRNSGHKGEHIIRLKVAGQEKVIWVNGNPAVAQAVNGVQRAKAWGWLRNASRALSNLFTTYSLDFTARNLIRDTMYSRMGLMVKENRAYRQQYRKNWWNNFGYGAFAFPMVRMMAQWESGRLQQKANPSRKEQMFMDFMRDGGATGYTIINSVDTIKRDLERAMRRSGEKGRKIRVPILGHYAAAVKTLNEGFELLTRFTAYQTSRQMGRSGQRSALDAKEISVNFNRQGAQSGKGGFMGALAAYMGATHYFYNAGVQGFDNFFRLFKAAPVKMTGSMAGLSLLGMMTPIINSAIAGLVSGLGGDDDDDKRDQWYWELPQWVRRNNIVLGWPGFYVTIPLPPEFRAFYGLGDIAASFMYDKVTGNNGFAVAGDILNTAAGVLPVNPIENFNSNGNVGVPEGVLRTFFPDAGMFIVDLATNRDFTGKPLAKENPYYDTTPASQAVYASDPEYLVKATQWLAQQTAGTPVYMDLNAGKLRDIFKNFGGGFYNTAEDVAKIFMADEKHPLRRDNIPFFSGFTGHLDEDRANNFENSALQEYKGISERVVRRISSAIGDKVSPADVYNNPENLPQEGRVQALLEGKDYQLGKMYHDGMNNRKEIIPGGAVYKSGKKKGQPKPETIPGVNKLRQNWKDMQDAYFAMPEGDEKEAFKLQVQDAFNKYHDAEGNLCDKLLEYENENAFLRLHWDKAQRRVYEDMKSLVR